MADIKPFLEQHPEHFVKWLKANNLRRFHFVYDEESKVLVPSHEILQPLADLLLSNPDFDNHEGLFFQVAKDSDILQAAFVHRTVRGHGAGGLRYWDYPNLAGFIRDGLRLSRGMTQKNALAGLWWGGGKGVMAHNPAVDRHDARIRSETFREYGRLMTAMRGVYVTAEDSGTNEADMADIFSTTRFITCIPEELGGSGNPSASTAKGVVSGIEAAIEHLNLGSLEGKVVAIQGVGNVGLPLLKMLLAAKVKKIIASDVDAKRVDLLKEQYKNQPVSIELAKPYDNSILSVECDVLAPCAGGGILNPMTIPHIKAKIVCGAANNQLADLERDDRALFERGIVYVPDFLANRMGIVNCANEQYGYVNNDPDFVKHLNKEWQHSIYLTTKKVLQQSVQHQHPPGQVAILMADQLAEVPHPIFGHRGRQIIHSLMQREWFK